jgi:hypothetical protein
MLAKPVLSFRFRGLSDLANVRSTHRSKPPASAARKIMCILVDRFSVEKASFLVWGFSAASVGTRATQPPTEDCSGKTTPRLELKELNRLITS